MARETYSSLKAVQGARRVAAGYLYREAIDPLELNCPSCGANLNGHSLRPAGKRSVECHACAAAVPLPPHVIAEIDREAAARHAWQPDRPPDPRPRANSREIIATTLVLLAALGLGYLLYIAFQLLPPPLPVGR